MRIGIVFPSFLMQTSNDRAQMAARVQVDKVARRIQFQECLKLTAMKMMMRWAGVAAKSLPNFDSAGKMKRIQIHSMEVDWSAT